MPLLESVPNLSEGRRPETIERLVASVAGVEGVELLDRSSDADHNRTVLTLAGHREPLERALVALYEEAIESIDLGRHRGVHPRIGAVDVTPFVPLAGATMADAVAAARSLGAAVADRFGLPVYLYEASATSAARRNLAEIRRGGLESLAERLPRPGWEPDFGPRQIHPRAGVTVVGARFFLIAFNVLLDTSDAALARRIARRVRESGGGLPAVKALGFALERRGLAQVSMNLTDYRRTSVATAFTAVRDTAMRLGVEVLESELVGLVPEAAMEGAAAAEIGLGDFGPHRTVEGRLRSVGLLPA